jgi:O-glycosyl hydrolase
MKNILFILAIFLPVWVGGQTTITVDLSTSYQTIKGFGASDAWNADYVGKYWGNTQKSEIAQYLFAKTYDDDGNPEGIGLSRWRFNIGGGSYELGDDSEIPKEERRVQCFLDEDGSYDWDKQAGQQWFLEQAADYGVEQLVAFVNSPPYFYTISGRTNTDYSSNFCSTNLKNGYYDEFADFLVTILSHFEEKGTSFAQISPVNEPQYSWAGGDDDAQEGCPYSNTEIKEVVEELDAAIVNAGLSTKILLAEAGSYKYLYNTESETHTHQIEDFFDSSSDNYLGDYSQVMNGIGAHSYWTEDDDDTIDSVRKVAYNTCLEISDSLELYQSEYSLLSNSYDDYLTNAVFLAKMIYADLAIGNVSLWDYWTAMERERWSQLNRYYLIRLIPTDGDYSDLDEGGEIETNKNLWALGNYSFFIRPGYKRISLQGADDLSGLMGSAYISDDSSKVVEVFVNWGSSSEKITHNFTNLPKNYYVKTITPYLTNASFDLALQNEITADDTYRVKSLSITTFVVELADSTSITPITTDISYKLVSNSSSLEIFPNPAINQVIVNSISMAKQSVNLEIRSILGNIVLKKVIETNQNEVVDISALSGGIYLVITPQGTKKLIKK